jgi:hypothetical protein
VRRVTDRCRPTSFFFLGADDKSRPAKQPYGRMPRVSTAITTVTRIHARRPRLPHAPLASVRVDRQRRWSHTSVCAETSVVARTRLRQSTVRHREPRPRRARKCVSRRWQNGNGAVCPCPRPFREDGCESYRSRDVSPSLPPPSQPTESTTTGEEATENGERVVAYGPRVKSGAPSPGAFGFFRISVATPHSVRQRSSPVGAASLLAR